MTTRLKGKRFRSVVADANVLWEVKRSRGAGVFECEVVDEPIEIRGVTYPGEFAGRRDVFTRERIERAIAMAEFFEQSMQKHEDFYDGLELGSTVHYDNGFGDFIRCEVVVAGEPHELDHSCVKQGERALRQVALVGNWKDHDLRFGGYHAERLDHLFKPNASCIWENPTSSTRKRHDDPSKLPERMGLTDCAHDIPAPAYDGHGGA